MSTPDQIGKYTIKKEKIGEGATAEVYLGRREDLDRTAAVKVLTRKDQKKRFLRGARIFSRLIENPGVATFYNFGEDPRAGPWIAMELLEGATLEEWLWSTPTPERTVRDVCEILTDVVRGLEGVHGQGAVHRDLKPENIFLVDEGEEDGVQGKILDFGLAKGGAGLKVTQAGDVFGTPIYMAPEQAEGEDVGPAADVYGVAAIAFEAVVGKPPFMGENPMEVMRKKTTNIPPEVTGLPGGSPLRTAIEGGLVRDPAERTNLERFRELVLAEIEQTETQNRLRQSLAGTESRVAFADTATPSEVGEGEDEETVTLTVSKQTLQAAAGGAGLLLVAIAAVSAFFVLYPDNGEERKKATKKARQVASRAFEAGAKKADEEANRRASKSAKKEGRSAAEQTIGSSASWAEGKKAARLIRRRARSISQEIEWARRPSSAGEEGQKKAPSQADDGFEFYD